MPGNGKGLNVIDRTSRAHTPVGIVLSELGEEVVNVFAVIKPLIFWPMIAGSAAVIRGFWPDSAYVIAFFAVASVVLAWFVFHLTFNKDKMATGHAVFSVLAVGALLCYTDVEGWHKVTVFAYLFGVFLLCASWSMRAVIKNHDRLNASMASGVFSVGGMDGTSATVINPDGTTVKTNAIAQPSTLYKKMRAKKRKKLNGATTVAAIESSDAMPTGKQRLDSAKPPNTLIIDMKPGDTIVDLEKRKLSIESAAGIPPGTLIINPDLTNARRAKAIVSDPNSLHTPIPYPGPSWLGGSIADPISVGLYQDGTEVEWELAGLQVQIMGMTGSGKSLGGAWATLADVITRHDVFVWGVDITKGQQTLGPLANALHRMETTPMGAMQLLTDVNTLIKPRTDYLASKDMGKWQRGCGLQYGIIWLEEVPDIMDALGSSGVQTWLKTVKAARSAGLSIVWSLQRSDATQVPTIARSQAVRWTFGVSDHREGLFGLSARQKGKCTPELWANRQPGSSYLDVPSIDDAYALMAMRAWYWGEDATLIRTHADNWPAIDRPLDALTASILAGVKPADRDTPEWPNSGIKNFSLAPPEPEKKLMDPAKARQLIRDWVMSNPEGTDIKAADLATERDKTGYGRQWGYKVMDEMERDKLVTKTKDADGVYWTVSAPIPS
jgi:hypothetical protein